MEYRKPIREYLDDPTLLRKVSLEDLRQWAKEVSYPAIIYQLMAMKVVQEEPSGSSKDVIRNALAYSPNPNKLSRDLYGIALGYENEATISNDIKEGLEAIPESEVEAGHPDSQIPIDDIPATKLSEHTEEELETAVDNANEDGLTSFSEWLLSLEQVEYKDTADPQEDEIISEALASLLLSQGHTEKALAMYERLALKYPEKSTYFAAQIENLRVS